MRCATESLIADVIASSSPDECCWLIAEAKSRGFRSRSAPTAPLMAMVAILDSSYLRYFRFNWTKYQVLQASEFNMI